MKIDTITLQALADKWRAKSITTPTTDVTIDDRRLKDFHWGKVVALKHCAEELELLIKLLSV